MNAREQFLPTLEPLMTMLSRSSVEKGSGLPSFDCRLMRVSTSQLTTLSAEMTLLKSETLVTCETVRELTDMLVMLAVWLKASARPSRLRSSKSVRSK